MGPPVISAPGAEGRGVMQMPRFLGIGGKKIKQNIHTMYLYSAWLQSKVGAILSKPLVNIHVGTSQET